MLKSLIKLKHTVQNLNSTVEYNVESYRKILKKINDIKLESVSECGLKEMAAELKMRACSGAAADDLLVEAFALVREASRRVLGLYPFDVQIIAGIAMHKGKLVEMQTGEGKTLTAVMPAYLNALTGKGVHILTFNDYLAYRDAVWMGPIYEFLGLTVGTVREGMGVEERQKAYCSDVTYVTAKESGFDYLRDFLCTEKEKLVQRPFHYAIVDEADSILIDEARIPLVIAGNESGEVRDDVRMAGIAKKLRYGSDYELDQYGRNVYLTDSGLHYVEGILECGNLYEPENLELLTELNCALYAEVLLERDRDYIVRDGKLELIDEFTGRIADKRHWPDNLHAAVEAKEGIGRGARGRVLGSVALQYFMDLYPVISGMTGTAHTAAAELKEFYGLDVVVIPTNKPCIRKDHSDVIFTHKAAKQKALVLEVKRVHETGRPLLIGTGSVEESELLAGELAAAGVACKVLNAKNDEMEAEIIAGAGEPWAVTVSTNMAGRGIDIKLGGKREQEREKVVALGGLYVMGSNHYESRRIDDQLRGRAGRQGDSGESRFFISLEDDLIANYGMLKMLPGHKLPQKRDVPVDDPAVGRCIINGQRIVEGYNSDIRRQLWKYSYIIEQQRLIIHRRRQDTLNDRIPLRLLCEKAAERYSSLCMNFGVEVLRKVEKQLTLYYINKCWADYLDYISYVREGIHLVVIGKKNPLDEFHRAATEAFDRMLENIDLDIVDKFNNACINENGIDMEKEGLKGPSSTWTYLVSDSPDQFSNLPFLIKAAAAAVSRPFS